MNRLAAAAALMLAAAPAPAPAADGGVTGQPGAAGRPPIPLPGPSAEHVVGAFGSAGELDRYSVPLVGGRDYAVGAAAEEGVRVVVRGPRGGVLADFPASIEAEDGREFRAARTGVHTIELAPGDGGEFPFRYWVRLLGDCPASSLTRCVLAPGGRPLNRTGAFSGDGDWLRLATVAGRRYALTATALGATVEVVDGAGRPVAGGAARSVSGTATVPFRAGRAPLYARVVERDDAGTPYRIGLAQR